MEIKIESLPVDYAKAMLQMEEIHGKVLLEETQEIAWLLEHFDIYTKGISAKDDELLSNSVPVCETKRGGKFTYHGAGQQVCYLMVNLKKRATKMPDIRRYVNCLEEIVIQTLAEFEIMAKRKEGYIGIWVENNGIDEKIGAIGVKFSKGVTMHGFALNVCPNLEKFKNIIPCGISEFGVCSMKSLGVNCTMQEVRQKIIEKINWANSVNFYQT